MSITSKVVQNLRDKGVKVYTRKQWDARYEDLYQWRREHRPAHQPADTVFQHITVTIDSGGSTGDFKADMRRLEAIGYKRFGTGISYNWVVDLETGEVGVGMPLDAKGAHTVNEKGVHGYSYDQNYMARAIAGLGMPDTPVSKAARRSIQKILIAMAQEGAITWEPDYVPHSLVAAKDCPCDNLRFLMPEIYKQFQKGRR